MNRWMQPLMVAGAILVLAGASVYITRWASAPYMYTVGATMVALAQFNSPIETKHNPTLKRLRVQQLLGAFLLVVTGSLMFFAHRNEWIVSLSVAAVLELYTAFRIPQELEK